MALRDLIIRPQTEALRYAASGFDELRSRFAEIMERKDVSEAVYKQAQIGRNRALSARVTIENAIEAALKSRAGPQDIDQP